MKIQMIHLASLKLHNFLSHENTEIQFQQNTKTLFDGDSGSGKSSILEAITWALYGEGRTDNRSLVRKGEKKAVVTLTLIDGDKTYAIERTIASTGGHKLSVLVNGTAHELAGLKELQDWIENDLVCASYVLFVNSVAYIQGGAESFVTQSATRRKELLLEIVKSVDFENYYERAKNKVSELELKNESVSTEIKLKSETISRLKTNIERKPIIETELKTVSDRTRELSAEVTSASEKVREVSADEGALNIVKGKISIARQELLLAESELDAAGRARIEYEGIEDFGIKKIQEEENLRIHEAKYESFGNVSEEYTHENLKLVKLLYNRVVIKDYTSEMDFISKQIKEEAEKPDCPAQDNCPYMQTKANRITELENRLVGIASMSSSNVRAFEEEKALIQIQEEVVEVLNVKKNERDLIGGAITEIKARITDYEKKIEKKNALYEVLKNEPILAQKVVNKKNELEILINEEQQLINSVDVEAQAKAKKVVEELELLMRASHSKEIGLLAELKNIEKDEVDVVEKEKELDILQKELSDISSQIQKLEILKDAFGSKGIKTLVIDYLLPDLEDKINDILSQMSDFKVQLDTQQEKASGEGSKEGLFITIINEVGETMPFESYSGGEKLKIVVSISEALATLQKVGFRMFDETILSLDENSLTGFMSVLDRLLNKYPQVLCVSHIPEIKSSFDDVFSVKKINGKSIITNE